MFTLALFSLPLTALMETLLHRFNGEYVLCFIHMFLDHFNFQANFKHFLWFYVCVFFSAELGASILAYAVSHVSVDAGFLHQTS